jgi:hypothetical protein
MNLPWYELVPADAPLDQGCLIADCPVIGWKDEPLLMINHGNAVDILQSAVEIAQVDVVVMTQTCDLTQNKVHFVILCPHYSLESYRLVWLDYQIEHGQSPTEKSWRRHLDSIVAGQIWNLAMLNSAEEEELSTELRIVDFHEVFSLPRDFLESWLKQRNQASLRLLPPYREHLSQAFARFFMRVGLPTDIHKVW